MQDARDDNDSAGFGGCRDLAKREREDIVKNVGEHHVVLRTGFPGSHVLTSKLHATHAVEGGVFLADVHGCRVVIKAADRFCS